MKIAVLELGSTTFRAARFDVRALDAGPGWACERPVGRLVRRERIDGVGFAVGLAAAAELLDRLGGADGVDRVIAVATGELAGALNAPTFADELRRRHGIALALLPPAAQLARRFDAVARGGDGEATVVVELGDGWIGLAGGHAAADATHVVSLEAYLDAARTAPLDRAARERLRGRARFALAGATRTLWALAPARITLVGEVAASLATLADELGLRAPGDGHLDRETLVRIGDVLAQFRPTTFDGASEVRLASDALAHGAIVLATVLDLLGLERAAIDPTGLDEALAGLAATATTGRRAAVA
jgi:hypothetical protein